MVSTAPEKIPNVLSQEKPSPFRGPKSQELVKFRKAIEKGNHDYFDEVSICVLHNAAILKLFMNDFQLNWTIIDSII